MTLVNLLLRFYEIDQGSISIDGIDIRQMTRDNLRLTFAMVLQDRWVFGGSIHDNIAYGREGLATSRCSSLAAGLTSNTSSGLYRRVTPRYWTMMPAVFPRVSDSS